MTVSIPLVHPPITKRILDLVLTVPLLVLISPLLAVIALAIKLTSAGPVLFRQERAGLGDEPFMMLKFRSMIVTAPGDDSALRQAFHEELAGVRQATGESFKLADDPRVTRVGKLIRATSIDELPQLINVVRGEMTLVGPRPALVWETEAFPQEFRRRTSVPPGCTGLWQVSGRSRLSTPEMLELDLEYVDRRSIWLDLQILFKTVPVLISRRRGALMPTLFVAKAGGHLTELVEIAARLPCNGDGVELWASNENEQSRVVLSDKPHVFVPYVGAEDLIGAAKCVPIAHRLHREYQFTRVVSTGSGTALPYLPYLAMRGVSADFIETATRLDHPSLTGRMLSFVPGIKLYTQYDELVQGHWHRAGWVFDRFQATKRSDRAVIRRAVVAAGSSNAGFPFRRMLEAVAGLLAPGGPLERAQEAPIETLWQTGGTSTEGLDIEGRTWVPTDELDYAISNADIVITHAGTGSAFSTMTAGRFPVLVPRDPDRGEIGDAHQRLFAAELDKRGLAMSREPEKLTIEDLLEAATYSVESVPVPTPIELLP